MSTTEVAFSATTRLMNKTGQDKPGFSDRAASFSVLICKWRMRSMWPIALLPDGKQGELTWADEMCASAPFQTGSGLLLSRLRPEVSSTMLSPAAAG